MNYDSLIPISIAIYGISSFRVRDFYVVVREFRIVDPDEFGIAKKIESYHPHCFDEYLAARAFFDLHESYARIPTYEDRQQINYLYAVPAFTSGLALTKMTKRVHHAAKLLISTPRSTIDDLRRYWDEERKARSE